MAGAVTRGYQPDEINEYALLAELAVLVGRWQDAERVVVDHVRMSLADGCRADVVCQQLGMSRATLYRWLRS